MKIAMRGRETIYTVVQVWRGFASAVHTFAARESAERCAARLRRKLNVDEDDVGVFQTKLNASRDR